MKLILMFLTITSFSIVAAEKEMPNLAEKGNANAGSNLVATCAACHGSDGNSVNSDWPKLAGQNQKYIYDQLKLFQSGDRQNALMMAVTPYLNTLKDEDLLDIAAFYESNATSVGQAKDDEELLKLGMSLYRGGNLKKRYTCMYSMPFSIWQWKWPCRLSSGGRSTSWLSNIYFKSI